MIIGQIGYVLELACAAARVSTNSVNAMARKSSSSAGRE